MGLDQYAYVAAKAGQRDEFYEGAEFNQDTREFENKTTTKPREIMYWRKHPNLQGWMEALWLRKGGSNEGSEWGTNFNGVELELTYEDLEELERAVVHEQLPSTSGFFFGDDADEYYREQDLQFIKEAKAEIFCGLKVFYNSSW